MGYPCTTCGIVYEQAWQAAICNHIVATEGKGFTMKTEGIPPIREYQESLPPRNRIRLEEGLEREADSGRGELRGYAYEKGRTDVMQEMMRQTSGRLECQYGSGDCIISIISTNPNSPLTGLTKCLKANQVGETRTPRGRKRRLERTGCREPGYTLFTKSWKCKYADGLPHKS